MATVEHIGIGDLPKALRRFKGRFLDGGVAAMRRAAMESRGIVVRAVDATKPHAPVNTGEYKQRWAVAAVRDGANLYNDAPHAAVIETGAKPYTPPFDPLLQWARQKLRGSSAAALAVVTAARKRTRSKSVLGRQGVAGRRKPSGGSKPWQPSAADDPKERAARAMAFAAWLNARAGRRKGAFVLKRSRPDMERAVERALEAELRKV